MTELELPPVLFWLLTVFLCGLVLAVIIDGLKEWHG